MTVPPLYHGSSQVFRDQIFTEGLSKPPTAAVNIPEYLATGFNLIAQKNGAQWKGNLDNLPFEVVNTRDMYFICRAALNTSGNQFNFRYGEIYLTSSLHRARSYASEVPESIRFGYTMFDLLKAQAIEFTNHPFVKTFIPIRQQLENAKPLVIKILKYDSALLYNEQGTELRVPVMDEQRSFEYRGTIPPIDFIEV